MRLGCEVLLRPLSTEAITSDENILMGAVLLADGTYANQRLASSLMCMQNQDIRV